MSARRVAVIGGGITGLAAALRLQRLDPTLQVTVFEADDRLGGKIKTSPFAGLPAIDEAADAFLTRVPHALALCDELGLSDRLTSPAIASANVWHHGMHRIPDGLLLGVPSGISKLATSDLLSWGGKARAALEPLLPATGVASDNIGLIARKRFGRQVQQRLIDPLVGSIYAADTDRLSLAAVPQIEALAARRSWLLAARSTRAAAAASAHGGPIFAAPINGMGSLISALALAITAAGGTILAANPATSLEADGGRWRVNDQVFDSVISAAPARQVAALVQAVSADAGKILARSEHAGVVMVTMTLPRDTWPEEFLQRSGYLVTKPAQRWVTAASFASSKWAHWNRGPILLRVSLGREGNDVTERSDESLMAAVIDEVGMHTGIAVEPIESRIGRWPAAFPQYRPGHRQRVATIEASLRRDAAGIFTAGASFNGVGIPACIADANKSAAAVCAFLNTLQD